MTGVNHVRMRYTATGMGQADKHIYLLKDRLVGELITIGPRCTKTCRLRTEGQLKTQSRSIHGAACMVLRLRCPYGRVEERAW